MVIYFIPLVVLLTRPTTDADYLLKDYSNDLNTIKTLINDIISTPTDNNFINIEFQSLERITEFKEYHGIRAKLIGKIGSTKTPFSIDIGVGDPIVPGPIKRFLPALLDNFYESEILTYSLESVISEKLQVIVSMMVLTSRMKDFYDIYYLACNFNFDGLKLQEAIKETFSKRATPIEKDSITDLSTLLDNVDFQKQWVNYCKNTLQKSLELSDIINKIIIFTAPLCEAIINELEYQKMWFADISGYKKYSKTAK